MKRIYEVECFLFAFLMLAVQGYSSGPIRVSEGKAVLWPKNQPVVYHVDQGNLATISHQEALNLVQRAFQEWQNVRGTSIQFEEGESLPVDVNGTNYYFYLNPNVRNLNPIVFDDDGAITRALNGQGAEHDYLGFSAILNVSYENSSIVNAYATFNGLYIQENQVDETEFYATILHELGHFIGLDHTQILRHVAWDYVGANDVYVPQMFPMKTDDESFRVGLVGDDRLAVSSLYPDSSVAFRTGGIRGVVRREEEEIPGVNIVARRVDSLTNEIYSAVSGTYERGRGTFELHGIPTGNYQLGIEPIDPLFRGSSSVGQYANYYSGQSFRNPIQSRFYHRENNPLNSRSQWSPIRIFAGRMISGIEIDAGTEVTTNDELDTVLLALNSAVMGAVPAAETTQSEFDYLFQYILDLTGRERSVALTVIPDSVTGTNYDVIVRRERKVLYHEIAAVSVSNGPAQVRFGLGGDVPLEEGRYFVAIRNRAPREMPFRLVTQELPITTPTPLRTSTPITTSMPIPTPTPRLTTVPPISTSTPTPTPQMTATPMLPSPPSPTAIEVNPVLGLVSLGEIGGLYPRSAAVHNFDIGISGEDGTVEIPGVYDGYYDPEALGPLLIINGELYPIAQDIEFSGEVDPQGNGSEGFYILIGGNIGSFPPVITRLGATGGENGGGIDTDNNPLNNIDFGTYQGDFVRVERYAHGAQGEIIFQAPLVDLEPAGNHGFYVLDRNGRIYAEGTALETLDRLSPPASFVSQAEAVSFVIYRGESISVTNSIYSEHLIGFGAYILDNLGMIHIVGNVPPINTEDIPLFQGGNPFSYHDLELIPNPEGTEWMGLGVLSGDGLIRFVPFQGIELTPELKRYIDSLNPFGGLPNGFSFDIARDFDVEISDIPLFGLNEQGETVATTGRRVGIFMFDGYGGIHTGGRSSRYAAAFGVMGNDIRSIEGFLAIPYPVIIPYTNVDSTRDVELAPMVVRSR